MTRQAEIRRRLEQAFTPESLDVLDESESHRGHAGFQEGGESHFRVRMRADSLSGKSRIAKHRAVHSAIGPDLMGEIHALALELES
ncbi:BolA family transcriptional regulator [Pseudooceanicola sp. HF7]|uniref:BolA family protein n=1 Tax=Pseudooceanicola sp. HF7 TaxID=2721560 RepID=UPI001430E977|nr:BolA family protein [Pseudooceanicola sp. HF7]NIZ09165.1 BolA family transcriptional regulator [Pseudooceanicola sp. HF7]